MPEDHLTPWSDPRFRLGRCELHLRDGRVLELTGLTVEEAMGVVREAGVTPPDVKETRHFIRWARKHEGQ